MPPARDDVESLAHGLIDRLVLLLEESWALRRRLVAQPFETVREEAVRRLYVEVMSVIEVGLAQTAEDLLAVLRREIGPGDNGR